MMVYSDPAWDELRAECEGWRTVALANQATAQSHQARWARAEAALQKIVDLGGAYGSRAWMADRIAREALADTDRKEQS